MLKLQFRRNLIALAFLVKFQKQLSLRVLVLQPLVITLIMLLSTAALVRRGASVIKGSYVLAI